MVLNRIATVNISAEEGLIRQVLNALKPRLANHKADFENAPLDELLAEDGADGIRVHVITQGPATHTSMVKKGGVMRPIASYNVNAGEIMITLEEQTPNSYLHATYKLRREAESVKLLGVVGGYD